MRPKQGGGRIFWPESGWPRHGPLVLAVIIVLVVLFVVFLFVVGPRRDGSDSTPDTATPSPAATID